MISCQYASRITLRREKVDSFNRYPFSLSAVHSLASVNGTSTSCRVTCARCLRPQVTCLCALTKATAHRTEVLVLQHPQERRQAKNGFVAVAQRW
jgi:hypothetical protein